jgi:hypothetical protein
VIKVLRPSEPLASPDGLSAASGGVVEDLDSVLRPSAGLLLRYRPDQDIEHFPDRLFPIGEVWQGQLLLHLITVTPAFPLLDHVARLGQIGDDGKRMPLGDIQFHPDVTQSDIGVAGDAEQSPTVVGKEAPLGHPRKDSRIIAEIYC